MAANVMRAEVMSFTQINLNQIQKMRCFSAKNGKHLRGDDYPHLLCHKIYEE